MQVKCEFRYFLKFFKFFSKKHLHFLQTSCIIIEYGSLVKRLRRRPLTAKTGVRFPYELLKVLQNPFSLKILFYIIRFVGQEAKTSPSHGENRGSIPLRTALFFIKQPNPKGTAGNRCCLQYFFVIKKTFVLDILFDRHCERSINMAVMIISPNHSV